MGFYTLQHTKKIDGDMPSHRMHKYTTELFFGAPYGQVHEAIDKAYVFAGRKHRRFFHDPLEAYVMGMIASSDSKGGPVGLFHVWLDEQCSKDKHLKKWLEFSAKQDALWKRQMRQMRKLFKKRK